MRELDLVLHLRNRFDTKDQLISVVTRIHLPRSGLVASSDHSTIENAGTIGAVQKERRKPDADIVMVARVRENPLLPVPRSDGKTGVFDAPTEFVSVVKDALPK